MLGSFQRARKVLRAEVARLSEAYDALETRIGEEARDGVRKDIQVLRARCAKLAAENAELQGQFAKYTTSASRDSADIARLRQRIAEANRELSLAKSDTIQQAQRAAEEERAADLQVSELEQKLGTEEALEGMLVVQWEMLEDLAAQVSLDPPWCCGLCSCKNPQTAFLCSVCESPKDGKTDLGNKAVEAYFEFRLHQEFLGRDPRPTPERSLAALKIALSHRRERWIEQDEIEELYACLKDLANNLAIDPVLRAEAALTLFTHGDEDARRLGKLMLRAMGENSDAVRRLCRGQRQQRVAVLYHNLLQMKQHDQKRFNAWMEKLVHAQCRYKQRCSVLGCDDAQDLEVEDFDDEDFDDLK